MLKCDYLVIGSGESGINLCRELLETGKKVYLVDDNRFGGNYLYNLEYPKFLLKKESLQFNNILKILKNISNISEQLKEYRRNIHKKIYNQSYRQANKILASFEKLPNFRYFQANGHFFSKTIFELIEKEEKFLISFKKAFLTNGKKEIVNPNIKGIENVDYLNQYNAYNIKQIPSKLAIIGFTKESIAVASYYAGLGIKVVIFEMQSTATILPFLDKSCYNYLIKKMQNSQIDIYFETSILEIKKTSKDLIVIDSNREEYNFSHIYVDVKSIYPEDNLKLNKIKIKTTHRGVVAKKNGETNQKHIFVFGDANHFYLANKKYNYIFDFVRKEKLKNNSKISLPLLSSWMGIKNYILPKIVYKIDSIYPVITIGFGEILAIKNFGTSIKFVILESIFFDGFIKIIYRSKTREVVGFALADQFCDKLEHYCINALSSKLKLNTILNHLYNNIIGISMYKN